MRHDLSLKNQHDNVTFSNFMTHYSILNNVIIHNGKIVETHLLKCEKCYEESDVI